MVDPSPELGHVMVTTPNTKQLHISLSTILGVPILRMHCKNRYFWKMRNILSLVGLISLEITRTAWTVSAASTPFIGGDLSSSPVRQFEPSWVASSAQGTAMAMTFDDSLLIFLRSPPSSLFRYDPFESTPSTTLDDVRVVPVDSTPVQFAPSWLQVGPNTICMMTGLASDVEHLYRVLQQQADTHFKLFERPITTHALAGALSKVMIKPTLSGSRPYAVQVLLLGGDDIDPDRKYGVYSLDPSGAWQSWAGTTAIGKYAKTLRKHLAEERQASTSSKKTLSEALRHAMVCWMKTCKDQDVRLSTDENDFQVLLLRGGRLYQIDKAAIVEASEAAIASISS